MLGAQQLEGGREGFGGKLAEDSLCCNSEYIAEQSKVCRNCMQRGYKAIWDLDG